MGSTLGSAFSSKKKLGVQKCVSESGATSPGRRRPAPMDNGGDTTENLLFFLCCKWLCKHTGAHLQGPHSRVAHQLANDTTMRIFGRIDSFLIRAAGNHAGRPNALYCTLLGLAIHQVVAENQPAHSRLTSVVSSSPLWSCSRPHAHRLSL